MANRKKMIVGLVVLYTGLVLTGCVSSMRASYSNLFKIYSVWQGTCDQPGYKPYPMILVIESRKGDAFDGITFYPKYGGGLIKVSGQIGPENIIKFTETEVVYGKVVSGSQYTATVKGNTLRGRYEGGEVFLRRVAD